MKIRWYKQRRAQSTVTVKYTTVYLQRGKTPRNECPTYDTYAEALGKVEHLFIVIAPSSTLTQSGSTW